MHDQLPSDPATPPAPPAASQPPRETPPPLYPIEKHVPRFRRCTGPTTPEGKAISSRNRLSHGCRSQQTVLPDEDPAEFEATIEAWIEAYGPQEPVASRLVEETALADWFLRRNRKRLDQIERRLSPDAWLWTDDDLKRFNNFTRYKTAAERSFIRAFKQLEAHVRRDIQDAQAHQRALALSARIFMKWISHTGKVEPEDRKIRQWIQVERHNGRTTTSIFPSNEQLQKRVASLPEPPCFLIRILNFPRGVPPEYSWAFPDDVQQLTACTAEQTMFYSDWLRVIDREASRPGGHIGPTDWLFDD